MNDYDEAAKGQPVEGESTLLGLFSAPPHNGDCKDESSEELIAPSTQEEAYFQQNCGELHSYDDMDRAQADIDAPAGSVSYMMGLFAPPGTTPNETVFSIPEDSPVIRPNPNLERPGMERQATAPRSNRFSSRGESEKTPLLDFDSDSASHSRDSSLNGLFSPVKATDITPKANADPANRKKVFMENGRAAHNRLPSVAMPAIQESSQDHKPPSASALLIQKMSRFCKTAAIEAVKPTTCIGSFMYLLYHVVFCLALGSAIHRPNNPTSILGLMTKTAALGTITSTSVYWVALNSEIPALYPTADLFLAPFLANLAVKVDQALANDDSVSDEDNDTIFLATFGVLSSIGICFSAALLVLSSVFKLANLGSFLPFPVICGFFSAVGIMTWILAVTVDTGGKSIGTILFSGDTELMLFALVHHLPGVVVASLMKYLGPKNPFYVIMVVFSTIGLFYAVMFATGVSLDEAKEMGWFWSHDELVYVSAGGSSAVGYGNWAPPAPFGLFNQMRKGLVHWQAVSDGLSTAIALGFLYLIRCSVHGAALKKNLPNLARTVRSSEVEPIIRSPNLGMRPSAVVRKRQFSEAVDIEAVMLQPGTSLGMGEKVGFQIIHAKPTNITLKEILVPYGISQFVSALFGGFAVTPAVAASTTMFSLGSEGLAPQVGAVLLLTLFYLTDFQLVGYIPKPAFSSLLVLAFIDMIYTWFYKSYFKIKDKSEWLVVPGIVVCAFVFDLLSAVFLGIAFSTFIFVGSFFRSGVVKYVANGSVIHSTIERPFRGSEWLNENGDVIHVLVLQNYLFFGNASAVYSYIGTLFQSDVADKDGDDEVLRKPRFLIIDLTLVTGMDTSTVDIFNDIRNLCKSNNCKMLMTGISPSVRTILALGGFKPETGVRSQRQLRFFSSLDAALGKAEDMLLDSEFDEKEISAEDARVRLLTEGDHGFPTALRHIDEQHREHFSVELVALQEYTKLVELNPKEKLYGEGQSNELERGLFFIESGILKIEHDTGATLTRGTLRSSTLGGSSLANGDSLTKIQAMSYASLLQSNPGGSQTFRLARIGPGWIAGTLEAVSGMRRPGDHVAVTYCRLHHLPFSKIQEVEKSNPSLALSLYKLLSYLMARRQEATIGQLATLHSIMTSPAMSVGPLQRVSSQL